MIEKYNILYVDDSIDMYISRYFGTNYRDTYQEYIFKEDDTYETILKIIKNDRINILIIDSKLFNNNNAGNKFTGEAFMMLLRKFNPYVEVIVITQNDSYNEIGALAKYRPGYEETIEEYCSKIEEAIQQAVKNINLYKQISLTLEESVGLDQYMVEKIKSAVYGITDYDDLTKEDIDRLIKSFNAISRGC